MLVSNISINCLDGEVQARKDLLKNSAAPFRAMFTKFREAHQSQIVMHEKVSTIEAFVEYLRYGGLPSCITERIALLVFLDKYDVDSTTLVSSLIASMNLYRRADEAAKIFEACYHLEDRTLIKNASRIVCDSLFENLTVCPNNCIASIRKHKQNTTFIETCLDNELLGAIINVRFTLMDKSQRKVLDHILACNCVNIYDVQHEELGRVVKAALLAPISHHVIKNVFNICSCEQ